MANLVIRNIDPELKRLIGDLAKRSGSSASAEAMSLIRRGICSDQRVDLGTRMRNLIDPEHRGDDLVVEYRGPTRPPPDFD